MTWDPGPRPEWVAAVNRGDVWPLTEAARAPFSIDRLTGEVAARLGSAPGDVRAELGDDALEGLSVLLPALEDEARLTILGRWITHRFLTRLAEGRVALEAYARRDPGVRDEAVREPWFIVGAPRTGTTQLHGMLARDERHRVPEGWELLRPVPPPGPEPVGDDDARVALADAELRTPQVVASGLVAIHEYSARMPKECLSAMSFAFRSEEFVARYDVPSYVAWLQRAGMRPAYDIHRLVLQVLQRRARPRRWVLKSPVHLNALPTLLAVYPDARLSVTHRDPLAVLGSVTSLIATMRWAHSDHVDVAAIGRYHAELYGRALDGLVDHTDAGLLDTPRMTHSTLGAFVADPLGVVAGLYAHFGWELTADAAARMRAFLDEGSGAASGHSYSFADLGLDEGAERARFARYAGRFGVAPAVAG